MLAAYDNTAPVAKAANAAYGASRDNTAPTAITPAGAARPVSVRLISTTSISDVTWGSGAISNVNPIDGVNVTNGDAVLFQNMASGGKNGIWIVDDQQPVFRRPEAGEPGYGLHANGLLVSAREGTANKGKVYELTTADPIELDTTALTFTALKTAGSAIPIS